MRILGIDPGCECTGFGVIASDGTHHRAVDFGAIRTQSKSPFHQRLLKIYKGLTTVLDKHPVDVVAIEEIFHSANVQAALKLGHARGVALLAAAAHDLPVFEYSPLEIKSAMVGYGRADKFQVQSMVRMLLHLEEIPKPHDAADALAVAICHSHRTSGILSRLPT